MSDQEVTEATLDAIVGDEEIAEPEPQEAETVEEEVTEQSEETPSEEVEEKTEEEPEEEPEADESQKMVPMSVVHGLRDEIKALKQDLAKKPEEQQEEPQREALPDPLEDPEGYEAALTARIEQSYTQKRLSDSETRARANHEDFQDKFDLYLRAAALDPSMVQDVMSHVDPAERAYQLATELETSLQPANSEEARAEIEKAVTEKLQSKHNEEIAALKKEIADLKLQNQLPDDFSGVSSDGSMRSSKDSAPVHTPLKDVLKS